MILVTKYQHTVAKNNWRKANQSERKMGCRGLKQILIDFSGWTSAHGLPHIGSAQSKWLRLFWTVVFIASFGMFVYQMYTLVARYLLFATSLQTTVGAV